MVIILIADCFQPGIEVRHLIEYQYITPVGYFLEDLSVKRLVGKEVNIVGKKKEMACRIFVLLEVNTPYPIGVINIKNRFVVAPYPILFRYHNEESMT